MFISCLLLVPGYVYVSLLLIPVSIFILFCCPFSLYAVQSAGVDLLQNMDVLKMIQQIRADPAAFKTYSNKRRLVSELNKFAMTDCELPVGWTARKDKHGRVGV